MNVLNRLLAIAVLFFMLLLAVAAIGIATGLLTVQTVDSVHSYIPLRRALSDFHASHPAETLVRKILVAAAISLFALLLLASEVTPSGPERTLRLSQDQDGDVTIGYRTMRRLAEFASMEVSGTQRSSCHISRDRNSLQVRCQVAIDRYANAEVIGSQVKTAIKRQLEQMLGWPVERVSVQVEIQRRNAPARVR